MDLLLHIGCEKTGTSSLQRWLDLNAGALAARGIVYSAVLGRPNNRRISYVGLDFGTRDEGLWLEGVRTEAQHDALLAQIARDIAAEAASARRAGCATFVISNEHCQSRLKTVESVGRLHALLAPLFDSMRVICLLRPQVDSCLSLASTLSRNGGSVDRDWMDRQMRPHAAFFALDQLLERWSAVFGKSQVMPVAFKRTPDVTGWFETLLGVAGAGLQPIPPVNGGLDWRVVAIVNAMNAGREGPREKEWGVPFPINELPVEQALTLDRATAERLQARYTDINAAVCRDWPEIVPEDLTPDWRRYPEVGTMERVTVAAEVGPPLRRILHRMRGEMLVQRALRLAISSERDMLTQQTASALSLCRQAAVAAREAVKAEANRPRMEALLKQLETRERRLLQAGAGPG